MGFWRRARDVAACREAVRAVQWYVDGELADVDMARISRHLKACRRCGLEARAYADIKNVLARQRRFVDGAALERLRSFAGGVCDEEIAVNTVAILVLAGTDSHDDLGRVVNALVAAKEFKEAGDDVRVVFDGAATRWPAALSDERHRAHSLYQAVADTVEGACGYCARAFEAEHSVRDAHVHLLSEYEGHPSIRRLVSEGRQVISF